MGNLEKLMLLTCRPTTEGAITALRSNNEDDRAPSNTADDMILCRRMMQASIDRRKLIPGGKANGSHSVELQSLRPYHCTYPNCSTGSKLYRCRSDWMEHEKLAHQQLWRCRDHHDFSCHSRDGFERHLMEEHRSLKEIHRKAWMDIYKPVTEDKRRHCPICLTSTGQLLDQSLAEHIAEHLEQFTSRASSYNASEARLQLLQVFNGSQSRQKPCSHPIPAQAPMLDLVYDRLKAQTFTTTPRDRTYGMLGISDIDDDPAGTKRSKAEDRNDNIKREATGDRSAVDIKMQQLPPTRHDRSMLDNRPEADRYLQRTQSSWHQPDLYPPLDEPYFYGPSLLPRTSLSGVGTSPVWTYTRATGAAPAYFPLFPNSTQTFVDGSIQDGGPISVADAERVPCGPEIHARSLACGKAPGSTSRPEQTNGSDPSKTGEPPSGRRSPVSLSHHTPYRTTSPAALAPDIVRSGGEALYNPPPILHIPRSLGWGSSQTSMDFPESARHEESGTPLGPGASVPSILQTPLFDGIRDQPTETSQRDRHKSSTNDATGDIHQPWPSWHQYGLYPQWGLPPTTFGFDDQDPSARSRATTAAPGDYGSFQHDPQSFVDEGLRGGGIPPSVANTESMSWLQGTYSGDPLPSLRWRSDAEQSDISESVEPPRRRRSRSPFRQAVQQRTKSPTPPWQCHMPLCRDRSFDLRSELLRHRETHHPPQKPLHSSAGYERSLTPLKKAGSSPTPFQTLVSFGHREQPTVTSLRERMKSSGDAAWPQRPTRPSPDLLASPLDASHTVRPREFSKRGSDDELEGDEDGWVLLDNSDGGNANSDGDGMGRIDDDEDDDDGDGRTRDPGELTHEEDS